MSLRLCSLSSGSRGNCILVAGDSASVIVDAGISSAQVSKGLKLLGLVKPSVLLTHCHGDHIANLGQITKRLKPEVYCHTDCYFETAKRMKGGRLIGVEGDFFIGDITVSPFRVSHDVPCVGYSFYQKGRKISIVTDLGCVNAAVIQALLGSDIVFIEANHDEELLMSNPAYPATLKRRILSNRGHLSNRACAKALIEIVGSGVKQIVLGHLSQENNYPELAHGTVSRLLGENGIAVGRDVNLDVALFGRPSNVFEVI